MQEAATRNGTENDQTSQDDSLKRYKFVTSQNVEEGSTSQFFKKVQRGNRSVNKRTKLHITRLYRVMFYMNKHKENTEARETNMNRADWTQIFEISTIEATRASSTFGGTFSRFHLFVSPFRFL